MIDTALRPPPAIRDTGAEMNTAPILVVDDTEANQYAMARVLRGAGYRVLVASNGAEALALARVHRPAVVVLDVLLPDRMGWEVCTELKRDSATAAIPVLEVSASYTADEDRARGLDHGADAYLVQPVDSAVLLATVRALLRLGEAQRALQRSEERLRTVLGAAPVVLFAADARGTYTLCTGSYLHRLGLDPEAMVGRSLYALHADEPAFLAHATQALQGRSFVAETPLRGHWLEVRYQPLAADAEGAAGFVAVATDITDRRNAERAREDLLAVMAHDLRAPIAAVQINIEILKRFHAAAPAPPPAQLALQRMERSAARATQLIAELLDQARLDAGTFTLERRRQRLEPLLREAADVLAPIAREQGARLVLVPAPDIEIDGDGARLLQAVSNLVENAIKFSPRGGTVTLRTEDRGHECLIAVEDDGPGIPAADLPHLFKRFWQGTGHRERGAGLGLAIAHGIVQAHGGRIWAENREGAGARFCIALPK